MDYNKFTVEDFVLDSRFRKWILDEDADLCFFWESYLKDHPEKISTLKEAKKVLLHLPDIHYTISDSKIDQMWQVIDKETSNSDVKSEKTTIVRALNANAVLHKKTEERTSFFTPDKLRGIAASLLLLIAFAYGYFAINYKNKEQTSIDQNIIITKTNPWGQKTTIYLSDGSEVILNSGSTITYNKNFAANAREIKLQGEAFFKVAKDTKRPFRVISGNLVTVALGTEFNVNAYDKDVTVALVEGKVQVSALSAGIKTSEILLPGEGLKLTGEEDKLGKYEFDQKKTLSWKEGVIYFNNASEKEVMKYLEEWYGIKIEIKNKSSKKWAFSGEFKNLSLENVLKSIGFTMGFRYERDDKKIIINYKPVNT